MNKKNIQSNIVLIGMAGAGKSSVGKKLADLLGREFVDVDQRIEEIQGKPLQELLNDLGVVGFRELEEKALLSLHCHNHVIATGGSAIYSDAGINHLKQSSLLVLLDVDLEILQGRVGDFSTRGLVKTDDMSFAEVFEERRPLYTRYADCRIECGQGTVLAICEAITSQLPDSFYHF